MSRKPTTRLSDEGELGARFDAVEVADHEVNRLAVRRAAGLADAIGFARQYPDVYVLPGDADAVATAERCAVMEAAARLRVSENTVRSTAFTADAARASLPRLWKAAWRGRVTLAVVEFAVSLLPRFDGVDAGSRVKAVVEFDAVVTGLT